MFKIILIKTLRDLKSSLAQTAALVLIVLLGVTSYVALIGAYRDLGTSYDHTYNLLDFADLTFAVQPIDQTILDRIAKEPGVSAITGRLILDTGLQLPGSADSPTGKAEEIRSRIIGLAADAHPQVNNVLVLQGRYFLPEDRDAALIESHFAETYHLTPGDTITPIINGKEKNFTIVGVVVSPEYLIVSPSKQEFFPTARTFAVLFIPIDRLQDITANKGKINDIAVKLQSSVDQVQIKENIRERLKPYGLISTTPRKDQPSSHALLADLEGFREIADMMPGLILLVAAASIYVMLGRQVRAQQTQIGLMKALGYKNSTIMAHYLAYALVIGVIGSILGVSIGLLMVGEITTEYAKELGIPLVQTRVYPDLIWQGVLLSIVFTLLAGLGPGISSMRMAPANAMRQDPALSQVKGRQSFIDKLILLPVWIRVSLRNVFRVRRRSLSTALGIIFGFILIMMTWGMLDSMTFMMDQTFNEVDRWDVTVAFSDFQSSSIQQRVNLMEGVYASEQVIQLPATIKLNSGDKDILLTAFSANQKMYRLQMNQGGSIDQAMSQGKIILTTALAENLGLHVGDAIKIEVLGRKRTLIVGGTENEMMIDNGYISLDTASKNLSLPANDLTTLYLTVDPQRASQLRSELYHMNNVAGVLLKNEVHSDWQTLMAFYYAFIGIMLIFAIGMTFAVLFNAMTVNVLERQRELATMRSIGTGCGLITSMILVENIFLWLLTLAPGLLAGYWGALQMGNAFKTDLFVFQMVIYPSSYILTSLGILLTMLLATLPTIRRVNRLNLAEATKVLT